MRNEAVTTNKLGQFVNFKGITISKAEANRLIDLLNAKAVEKWTINKLLDNLDLINDNWEIRISMVSLRDLKKHDKRFFTDGNHNGRVAVIKKRD